ncbi:MAG: carbohydrate-binding protein, partial [Bacteroidota bacterium]|nr:carbohydrate-binding protein [Bacteroidota bacterium]
QSYIMFKKLDLNEINHLVFAVDPNKTRGLIEVRLDAPDGRLFAASPAVSKADKPAGSTGRWFDVTAKTENVQGVHDVYFIFKMETDANSESANIWNSFLLNTIYFGKEKLQ